MGVDIPRKAVAVGKFGRIPSFPQVFIDLADAAGAGFTALPFVGQEGRWPGVSLILSNFSNKVKASCMTAVSCNRVLKGGCSN